ncbi:MULTISPECIES: ROK family protein [unclassified Streptomyces]|uniref:ROK family protein n=1 Tax=unclassified Streptomyces TaxID=2593676 RepID=UPI00343F992D
MTAMRDMDEARKPVLSDRDREALHAWARGGPERSVRARIVLDAEAGLSVSGSARALGVSRPTVTTWRKRYAAEGLAGLEHRPRSGRPPQVDEADLVAATLAGPPAPARTWSARALAERLGVSHTTLAGVWRRWQVGPGEGSLPIVPVEPALSCARAELLAVWARADSAVLVIGEALAHEGPRGRATDADERRSRHAALAAQLDRVRDTEPLPAGPPVAGATTDGASAKSVPVTRDQGPGALITSTAARHPGRALHIITWDDEASAADEAAADDAAPDSHPGHDALPAATWHRADSTMSWSATACTVALAELAQFPGRFRAVLHALTEAARAYADAPGDRAFGWQRSETRAVPAPPRPAPRAFNQLALGSYNEKLVIENIREAGALSRVEIAEQTGLTPQAVSRITRNLLTAGLLAEDGRQSAGAGKPRVPLRLRPDAASAIGVHLDPEMITVVAVDLCGGILDRRQMRLFERRDPDWCLEHMTRLALESAAVARQVSHDLLGVGVAVPGPVDARAGIVLDPPLFDGWEQVELKAELVERLGTAVIVEKDATAAAIGERWLGAADRADDFVYLYLGAGAGSGAFLNGDVYRGTTGNAGEVGELCAIRAGLLTDEGGPRMVAECAPISGVVDQARAAGLMVPQGDGAYDWVCEAAARGDERAVAVVENVAGTVALGAVGIIDLLDVELLVVGGPAVLQSVADLYLGRIAAAVNRFPVARRVRDVHVAQSRPNQAAAVGAASSVFHSAFTPRLSPRGRSARGASTHA